MISISDNTAADMLINLVGRSAVQAQDRQWSDHAALNVPFLTTREAFILKLSQWPALANRYIAANQAGRQALLASTGRPDASSRPGGGASVDHAAGHRHHRMVRLAG